MTWRSPLHLFKGKETKLLLCSWVDVHLGSLTSHLCGFYCFSLWFSMFCYSLLIFSLWLESQLSQNTVWQTDSCMCFGNILRRGNLSGFEICGCLCSPSSTLSNGGWWNQKSNYLWLRLFLKAGFPLSCYRPLVDAYAQGQVMVYGDLCDAVRMPYAGACMVGLQLLNFSLLSYVLNLPQLACLLGHMLLAIDAQSTGRKGSLFQGGVASLLCWLLLGPSLWPSQDEPFRLHLKPGCGCGIARTWCALRTNVTFSWNFR